MPAASWTVRALPQEVRTLRDAVAAFVRSCGIDHVPLQDVRLALSEAASNVVRHAYAEGDAGPMTVAVEVADDEVRVCVRDAGPGLRPRPDSAGAGLGLPLMASIALELDVHEPAGGGTEVHMRFRRFEHRAVSSASCPRSGTGSGPSSASSVRSPVSR
jgi:serine/threonine-protein kinase RsbW